MKQAYPWCSISFWLSLGSNNKEIDGFVALWGLAHMYIQPCVIFMDEIEAIGGRRISEGTSADREIQRTLMKLLNQVRKRRSRLLPLS